MSSVYSKSYINLFLPKRTKSKIHRDIYNNKETHNDFMMMSPTTQRTIAQNKNSLLPSSQSTSINSPISSKPIPKANNAFKNKYDFILEQLSNLSSSNNIKSNNRNQHNISTFSNSDFISSSYSTLSFHNKQPSPNILF